MFEYTVTVDYLNARDEIHTIERRVMAPNPDAAVAAVVDAEALPLSAVEGSTADLGW